MSEPTTLTARLIDPKRFDEALAPLEKLHQDATDAPWGGNWDEVRAADDQHVLFKVESPPGNQFDEHMANADLVTVYRNAAPELFAAIRALHAQLAAAKAESEKYLEWASAGGTPVGLCCSRCDDLIKRIHGIAITQDDGTALCLFHAYERACKELAALHAQVATLTAERDAALADTERLRNAAIAAMRVYRDPNDTQSYWEELYAAIDAARGKS